MKLRDRLRHFLLGAASLFDFSGSLTYRATRDTLLPQDDWQAIGEYFRAAARDIRNVMPEPREDKDRDR